MSKIKDFSQKVHAFQVEPGERVSVVMNTAGNRKTLRANVGDWVVTDQLDQTTIIPGWMFSRMFKRVKRGKKE